ncbi:MAG: tetratricopeptide repeat protein [Armatimonadota bacterium]|jgi:tetratricopeptide (TPR) repeat protein
MWPFRGRRRQDGGRDDLLRRGSRALRRRRFDEAIELLEAAVRLGAQDAAARNNLGTAYHLRGQHAQSLEHFEAAAQLKPDDAAPVLNLAAAHNALGHIAEAVELLEQLRTRHPTHQDVNFNLAIAYHRQGRTKEAVEALQRELKLNPKSRHATSLLRQIVGQIAERASGSRE